jgi:Uma2 family endonuclease
MQVYEEIIEAPPGGVPDFDRLYTLEEFLSLELPDDDYEYELLKGKLVARKKSGVSAGHGYVIGRLVQHLNNYLDTHPIGRVYDQASCTLENRDPEASYVEPDVCFVPNEKLRRAADGNYLEFEDAIDAVPELVVEVVSPSDSERLLKEKIETYQAAGVKLIWLVHFLRNYVFVQKLGADRRLILELQDNLMDDDVLPGFSLSVHKLLR